MPMTPQQRTLWSKIAAFEIDDAGSDFQFSRRLARENGWPAEYAARVIEEYRRFVFLAFAAGHPVTPSVDVDEAWHLHLLYTRGYWEDLCRDTLGGPLHHGPTKGGRAEADKFDDWYRRTLNSYERLFDRPAPADIWPAPEIRFGPGSRTVHVRPATHWIVPKPHVAIAKSLAKWRCARTWRSTAPRAFAPILALAATGCLAVGGGPEANGFPNPVTHFDAMRFLAFYPALWVVAFALATWFQRILLYEPVPEETVREFQRESPETIALLQARLGNRQRLAELLMGRLIAAGRIRFDTEQRRYVRADRDAPPANPFDAEMLIVIEAAESAVRPFAVADYVTAIHERPLVQSAADRLGQRDLFLENAPLGWAEIVGVVALAAWLTIGMARVQVGMARHRPIGFLLLEMVVGGVIGSLWLIRPVLRKRYAPASIVTRGMKRATAGRIPELRQRYAAVALSTADDDYWRTVAIAGAYVLPSTDAYRDFLAYVQPPPAAGDAGCSGGGCGGGGCGGCGGCGG